MEAPSTHGIDVTKLRIPFRGWRLILLLRKLRGKIKRQAINHNDVCKNQDTIKQVMDRCKCTNIK